MGINYIDLIIVGLLICFVISGWRNGIMMQLAGILGVLVAAFIAYHFSHVIGRWCGLENAPTEVLFFTVLILVLLAVLVLCWIFARPLDRGKYRAFFSILGAGFGFLKGMLLLSLVTLGLAAMERESGVKLPKAMKESPTYQWMYDTGVKTYPYIAHVKTVFIEAVREEPKEGRMRPVRGTTWKQGPRPEEAMPERDSQERSATRKDTVAAKTTKAQ